MCETWVFPDDENVNEVIDLHVSVETPHRMDRGVAELESNLDHFIMYAVLRRKFHETYQSIISVMRAAILFVEYISKMFKPWDEKTLLAQTKNPSRGHSVVSNDLNAYPAIWGSETNHGAFGKCAKPNGWMLSVAKSLLCLMQNCSSTPNIAFIKVRKHRNATKMSKLQRQSIVIKKPVVTTVGTGGEKFVEGRPTPNRQQPNACEQACRT